MACVNTWLGEIDDENPYNKYLKCRIYCEAEQVTARVHGAKCVAMLTNYARLHTGISNMRAHIQARGSKFRHDTLLLPCLNASWQTLALRAATGGALFKFSCFAAARAACVSTWLGE